jgi:hypothetical protein
MTSAAVSSSCPAHGSSLRGDVTRLIRRPIQVGDLPGRPTGKQLRAPRKGTLRAVW